VRHIGWAGESWLGDIGLLSETTSTCLPERWTRLVYAQMFECSAIAPSERY